MSKSTCRFTAKLPDLGQADVEQLTEAISRLLDKCTVGARLVLTTTSKELIVSVVGRGHTPGPTMRSRASESEHTKSSPLMAPPG